MVEDRIIITDPDGEERSVPLTFRGLALGSGSKNDVILSGSGVSQQHLRITFDGATGRYSVLPLPASLPAHLDDDQLLPSVEREWSSDQTLQVGQNSIQLVQVQAAPAPQPASLPTAEEPEPQPLRIFMIGMGVLIIVVTLYIVFGGFG